jgi:hypothetical protein
MRRALVGSDRLGSGCLVLRADTRENPEGKNGVMTASNDFFFFFIFFFSNFSFHENKFLVNLIKFLLNALEILSYPCQFLVVKCLLPLKIGVGTRSKNRNGE